MVGSDTAAFIAVEVLVEEDVVAPVRIVLELLLTAEHRTLAGLFLVESRSGRLIRFLHLESNGSESKEAGGVAAHRDLLGAGEHGRPRLDGGAVHVEGPVRAGHPRDAAVVGEHGGVGEQGRQLLVTRFDLGKSFEHEVRIAGVRSTHRMLI